MKPLTSLRVLDLTSGNPYLGSMLADYGADVLQIEPPVSGDPMRRRGAEAGQKEGPYYAYYGRNKKSMALDLSVPKGQEILLRMLPQFDMLVANRSEQALGEWGLGYDAVHAANPKLVYGILTPFGEEGPWKDFPDYDLLVMARSGLLEKTGFPERPTKFGFPLSYFYAGWQLAAGMLAAYLRAQETGEGCKVSTSSWHTIVLHGFHLLLAFNRFFGRYLCRVPARHERPAQATGQRLPHHQPDRYLPLQKRLVRAQHRQRRPVAFLCAHGGQHGMG